MVKRTDIFFLWLFFVLCFVFFHRPDLKREKGSKLGVEVPRLGKVLGYFPCLSPVFGIDH